jgi:hypothetical protein
MPSNRRNARLIAMLLALAFLATVAPVSTAPAGPIGDMMARHRQARQMKLPAVDKPHTIKPYRDTNARTASLSQRFKQRFSLKKGANFQDQGVIKTSR